MKRIRAFALLLALCLLLSACGGTQTPLERTAKYLKSAVPEPGFGSLDGDWIVFGLARAGADLPDGYFDRYYTAVEAAVQAADGTLDENRYTEYSRLILALTAIGRDPQNVGGYDLLLPLADLEKTTAQGVNGAAFALLALDCGGYELPQNSAAAVQATRDGYVDAILTRQNADGGWSLGGGASDPDLTAMALQALARYRSRADVSAAVEAGLSCLSQMQEENGAFSSWGTESSESVSQVLTALTELGLSLDDARFVKNGQTLEDVLLRFAQDDGSFAIRRRTEATCLLPRRRSTPSPLSSAPETENPPSTICQTLRPESLHPNPHPAARKGEDFRVLQHTPDTFPVHRHRSVL